MDKAVFYPVWQPFALNDITEGQGVNIVAPVAVEAVVNLAAGEHHFLIDAADALALLAVERDGSPISYTIADGIVSIPSTERQTLIVLRRTAVLSYEVFGGQLPPGIQLIGGHLRGIVANIPSKASVNYRFGLRCHYGEQAVDIIRSWRGIPADETLTWNFLTLPPAITGPISTMAYYSYGEFKRGQKIDFDIDIFNPDSTPLEVLTRPASNIVSGVLPRLPDGITISSNPCRISGFIPAEALPGDYAVELWVDEPFPLPPIVIHMHVLANSFDKFTAVNRLTFSTQSDLGTVSEGETSLLTIEAQNSSNDSVNYSLSAGSRSLPVGIRLSANGELQGVFPHVSALTSYEFTVKATSGRYVATREYKLDVVPKFITGKTASLNLPLSGSMKKALAKNASHLTDLYRSGDPYLMPTNEINILSGIRASNITQMPPLMPTSLILGEYKYETIRKDDRDICDVIYRVVIDPKEKSGGFALGDDIIPEQVVYPQNSSIQIREPSLNNIRREVVQRCGMDTRSGKLTSEPLPVWQDNFSPILIVGYVKANTAKSQIAQLPYGEAPKGEIVAFDRILIREGLNAYFFYLGTSGKPLTVVAGAPLPPIDLRIDGVAVGQAKSHYSEPSFSWTAQEVDTVFSIEVYNGGTLLRSEEVSGTAFRYTTVFQDVDSNPSYITFVIRSKRGDSMSSPVIAGALIRGGWGNAWGMSYGSV